jgi:hypothetical protein
MEHGLNIVSLQENHLCNLYLPTINNINIAAVGIAEVGTT